jgi:hypothetical protein
VPTDEEAISYRDALFRMNDLCGQRVTAQVCDPDTAFLVVVGTLEHDTENGELWGCYFVGEAKLDLTGFQAHDRHWAATGAVSFYGRDGLRVEVRATPRPRRVGIDSVSGHR